MNEININDATFSNAETEEEEILTPEEVTTLDGKTEEELTDVEKKNKKLYARTKAKDAENKTLKEKTLELEAKIKELEANTKPITQEQKVEVEKIVEQDPIEFAKKVRMLSTLDDEEISYAQVLAKGTGTSVEQVIMTDDFKLWSNAHKDKIKQDNSNLSPSNKTERTEKEDEMFKKFSSNLPKGFEITKK